MQLDILKSQPHMDWHGLVHALVMEDLLLILWALTTTVSQDLIVLHGFLWSTLMIHCGMDKVVMDLSVHAVIFQTCLGSAGNFLSQLLMTWRFASVVMELLRTLPLTLFNSTFNEHDNVVCEQE